MLRSLSAIEILQKTLRTGAVTAGYPKTGAGLSADFRGAPEFELAQ